MYNKGLQSGTVIQWSLFLHQSKHAQIARFMWPTWGPPGSCRSQVGPMLAPWTLPSGWYCAQVKTKITTGTHKTYTLSHLHRQAKWREWGRKLSLLGLTHWGRDKMAAILQTTFSNAFSWMKIYKFRLRFHWSLFPRVQLTIYPHWFR